MIDAETVERFQRDGAVCIRQLFRPEEMAVLRAGIDENLAHLSPRAKVASTQPTIRVDSSRTSAIGRTMPTTGASSSIRRCPKRRAGSCAAHRRCITITCSPRNPAPAQPTPWHQDQPYYNIEGRQNVSFWIPVDPVSRESTLEFVAGSHLGPWLMPRSFMDAQAKWFPEGTLADLPNIEAARDAFPILGWELQPGDAVCFHMLTCTPPAASPARTAAGYFPCAFSATTSRMRRAAGGPRRNFPA
jgi:hypothetical protein